MSLVKTSKQRLSGGNGMGTITIDHSPLNVLSQGVIAHLGAAFDDLQSDPEVQVIKLEAVPREVGKEGEKKTYFSAGADVKMLARYAGDSTMARAFFDGLMQFSMILERSSKPLVAAVDGICYGGALELALMCDRIYATSRSVFAFKEINHRIFPGWGGTQRAVRRMGTNRFPLAFEMVVTGADVNAQTALQWGLVDGVGSIEDVDRVMDAHAMAPDMALRKESQGIEVPTLSPRTIARLGEGRSRKAVDLAYYAMLYGNRKPLEEGLAIERDCFLECFGAPEAQQMLAAFKTGEKPEFHPALSY